METIKVINPIKFEYKGTVYDNVNSLIQAETTKINNILANAIEGQKQRDPYYYTGYYAEYRVYRTILTEQQGWVRSKLDEMDKLHEELQNAVRQLEYSNKKEALKDEQ
jgi:hypothetical protein